MPATTGALAPGRLADGARRRRAGRRPRARDLKPPRHRVAGRAVRRALEQSEGSRRV